MRKRLTVEDLMTTAVISLRATDTVDRLRAEMAQASVRHIPVVDEGNRVIGIVSDRDLSRRSNHHPGTPHVADLMTHPARTVRPSTPAHAAAAILIEHKIGSLPVVGEDEQLVGVITESDFLAVAERALRGQES
jgi:CBS domain-containing protein